MSRLDAIMRNNDIVVSILSEYINNHPRFIDAPMVEDLARECHVSNHEAFCTLLSAACGLDTVDNPAHRALERQYLIPAIKKLDTAVYENDAYAKTVRFPNVTHGKWELCQHSYRSEEHTSELQSLKSFFA